jgi:hypothetical protein
MPGTPRGLSGFFFNRIGSQIEVIHSRIKPKFFRLLVFFKRLLKFAVPFGGRIQNSRRIQNFELLNV